MSDNDNPVNGICIDGKFYEVVMTDKDDFHKCDKCALTEFCCDLAPFPCAEELSDPKDSNMHYYRFSQSITDKINGKKRGYGPWGCVHCSENGTCTHDEVQYDRCVAYGNSGIGCAFAEKD